MAALSCAVRVLPGWAAGRIFGKPEACCCPSASPRCLLAPLPADLASGAVTTLVEGADFYACPRLSPDGCKLAWVCWEHPSMPWDDTQLWVADVAPDGTLSNHSKVRRTAPHGPGGQPCQLAGCGHSHGLLSWYPSAA